MNAGVATRMDHKDLQPIVMCSVLQILLSHVEVSLQMMSTELYMYSQSWAGCYASRVYREMLLNYCDLNIRNSISTDITYLVQCSIQSPDSLL